MKPCTTMPLRMRVLCCARTILTVPKSSYHSPAHVQDGSCMNRHVGLATSANACTHTSHLQVLKHDVMLVLVAVLVRSSDIVVQVERQLLGLRLQHAAARLALLRCCSAGMDGVHAATYPYLPTRAASDDLTSTRHLATKDRSDQQPTSDDIFEEGALAMFRRSARFRCSAFRRMCCSTCR
jgi:hypothetical protein